MDTNELLTPEEAAAYLHVTTGALSQWRYKRTGPVFYRASPKTIIYKRSDLDGWLAASVVKPEV